MERAAGSLRRRAWLARLVHLAAPAPGLSALRAAAGTQTDPIRLIVPFAAGGPADLLARTLTPLWAERTGRTWLIENRPGAGGTLGAAAVARAAADGHTLLLATSSTHSLAPLLGGSPPYDAVSDFTPVVAIADAPGVVLVPNSSPARTLPEFIEHARRHPGRLSYASSGPGTIVHLATEYLKAETGTYIVHIPYRGTAPAMTDLIGGTVDLLMDSLLTALPQVREGRVRALAVTSRQRTRLAPTLPAVAEFVPGYEAVTWFGLFGPKGLSPAIVATLNRAANEVLAEASTRERLARLGAEPVGGTPAQLALRLQVEGRRWRRLVAERGLKLE